MLVAIDTETHLITEVNKRPPMVSLAMASSAGDDALWSATVNRAPLKRFLRDLFESRDTVVGHNLAYDMEVIRQAFPDLSDLIFEKYERGEVWCTKVAEMLFAIAEGTRAARGFSLKELSAAYGSVLKDEDPDGWRLRYAELDGVKVSAWPKEAVRYAKVDAVATLKVAERQRILAAETLRAWWVFDGRPSLMQMRKLTDLEAQRQFRYAYALHLMGCEGVRVDPAAVTELDNRLTTEIAELREGLIASGLVRDNPKNKSGLSKDLKKVRALVQECLGESTPVSDKGNIETNKRTLLATKHPDLIRLAEFSKPEKMKSFLVTLVTAVGNGGRFCPGWNVLVDTGRTSCGGKESPGNLQNQPRSGGVRECFIPSEGKVYCADDYATAELRSLAQVQLQWFGKSSMADVLRAGADLHQELADSLDWLDRQGAKAINFGAPGGLGAATLAEYAEASYGVQLSDDQAIEALDAFLGRWPEMGRYFDAVSRMTRDFPARFVQSWSNRLRGGLGFTNGANTMFQGLTADGAKLALWNLTRECYAGQLKDLEVRPVLFEHDEIITEGPADDAHVWAEAKDAIMRESMARVTPDIPVETEPALMSRWYKGAKPVRDAQGRLQLWTPS